jgi:hypothetical protein
VGRILSQSQTSATGSGTDDISDQTKPSLKGVSARVDHGGDRCLAVNRDDQHVRAQRCFRAQISFIAQELSNGRKLHGSIPRATLRALQIVPEMWYRKRWKPNKMW